MLFGLLGPHVNSSPGGIPEFVGNWKPAVATVLDPTLAWRAIAQNTRTRFIWRPYEAHQPDWNQPLDPIAQAMSWTAKWLSKMLEFTGCGGYWQGDNEPTIASPEAMARYALFEVERLRLLDRYRLRGAIGSFSNGNPSNLSWYEQFKPALEACVKYRGVFLLHQYNFPKLEGDATHDPAWLSLRHRKVYDGEPSHNWAGLPANLRVPLIISECGRDSVFGEPNGGWRNWMSPTEYFNSLLWYDNELQKDTYVLGACVYCLSAESWQWCWYDIWPDVAQMIAGRTSAIYRPLPTLLEDPTQPRGVDVGSQKGKIDWKRVSDSGISFALLRSSVGTWRDPEWSRNRNGTASQGLLVWPWHFIVWDEPIRDQASTFLRQTGNNFKVIYGDIETDSTRGGKGPSDEQVHEFVDRLRQANQNPALYTSKYMVSKLGIGAWAGELGKAWLADWSSRYYGKPRMPSGWSGWTFQQVSSCGSVPGVPGRCDLDIYNGSYSQMVQEL